MDLQPPSIVQKGRRKETSLTKQKGNQKETLSTLQKVRRRKTQGAYRGVRLRDGKWVSEIRIPKTNRRIWLGSHHSPEKAAQAYDAALYCIRGAGEQFNFPNNKRPQLVDGSVGSLAVDEIKKIAEEFASMDESVAASEPSPMLLPTTTQLMLDKPVSLDPLDTTEMVACKVGCEPYIPALVPEVEPYVPVFVPEAAPSSHENLQLDDLVMQDTDWILDFL